MSKLGRSRIKSAAGDTMIGCGHLPLRRSSGFALISALVFLLVLTLLGVATLSSNVLQEKMTYATGDYSRAFTSADSAIVEAESWLAQQTVLPVEMQSCSSGCTPMVWQKDYPLQHYSLGTGSWPAFQWSSYARSFVYDYSATGDATPRTASTSNPTDPKLLRTSSPPMYVIEELGRDRTSSLNSGQGRQSRRYYYRITAHGAGIASSAYSQSVFVQSFN